MTDLPFRHLEDDQLLGLKRAINLFAYWVAFFVCVVLILLLKAGEQVGKVLFHEKDGSDNAGVNVPPVDERDSEVDAARFWLR